MSRFLRKIDDVKIPNVQNVLVASDDQSSNAQFLTTAQTSGAVDLKLTAEEIASLEKPYRPHPILGHAQPSAKNMLKC